MNRRVAAVLLIVSLGGLMLTAREAAAQPPQSIVWEQPRPFTGGAVLGPTAAYPTNPAYYAMSGADCQCVECRMARGETRSVSSVTFGMRGLWRLEQRKNSFLKRTFLD